MTHPDDTVPAPPAAAVPPVSVMIFTLNEATHLPSCLDAARWCDDVIVVDSFSTDATKDIAQAHGARFFQNAFTGFGTQRNWALANTAPKHEWILILDADERMTPELVDEMRQVLGRPPRTVGAYRVKRRFYMWGRWLRYSSLYPTWVVRLIHRDRVRYLDRGHAETQHVDGEVHELQHDLIDENLKGIDEWFARQNKYAQKEAEHEVRESLRPWRFTQLVTSDPLKRRDALKRLAWRMPARPLLYFVYSYLVRQGFRDGNDGLRFCMMKAIYQATIVIRKYDIRRNARSMVT